MGEEIEISFALKEDRAKVVLKVLNTVGQNTNNATIRKVMKYLHQNIKKDIWADNYIELLLIAKLTKESGVVGIHKNSSLKNYIGFSHHAMVHLLPKWCNAILKKVAIEGDLGKPSKKITSQQTVKAKKVLDLIKLIINELP
ncbi:hypothetical protein [Aquimarina megaterium]|uniref:hypothetical protein n=1 Tax=Aquimarina megaterium TaxID=1443666 RepID=UPI00046F0589|nr:hypothetical protein [Aquimarina megaterium]